MLAPGAPAAGNGARKHAQQGEPFCLELEIMALHGIDASKRLSVRLGCEQSVVSRADQSPYCRHGCRSPGPGTRSL